MAKYVVLLLTGVLLIGYTNCSSNEFQQTGDSVKNLECLDENCNRFKVTENAYNPIVNKKADILFIFDNSNSMIEENNELANRMSGFIQALNNNQVDYNLCYTLSDSATFNSGRIQPWSNNARVINKSTPNLTSVFLDTVDMINNNTAQTANEQPIAASNKIFNDSRNRDCFRSDTAINVVFLTDEDENGDGTNLQTQNMPNTLINTARNVFGAVPFSVHSIIAYTNFFCYATTNNIKADTHYELSQLTGGAVGDVCSDDYTTQLDDIYSQIQNTLDSVVLKCDPVDGTLEITSSNNINYSSEIRDGRLYLTPGIPEDSSVTVTYECIK